MVQVRGLRSALMAARMIGIQRHHAKDGTQVNEALRCFSAEALVVAAQKGEVDTMQQIVLPGAALEAEISIAEVMQVISCKYYTSFI